MSRTSLIAGIIEQLSTIGEHITDWNLTIIGALLFSTGYRIGHGRGQAAAERHRAWQTDPTITDEDIKTERRAGRKIKAIKLYRQRGGAGVKEAKAAVEAMDAGMGNVRTVH